MQMELPYLATLVQLDSNTNQVFIGSFNGIHGETNFTLGSVNLATQTYSSILVFEKAYTFVSMGSSYAYISGEMFVMSMMYLASEFFIVTVDINTNDIKVYPQPQYLAQALVQFSSTLSNSRRFMMQQQILSSVSTVM